MTKLTDKYPPPHARYLVHRRGKFFTATPCYGMHAPWWVVALMPEHWPNEAEPVAMDETTDSWMTLDEAVERLTKEADHGSDESPRTRHAGELLE